MPISDMPQETVLEIISLLNGHGIELILDGGWAVDALLGYQSRPHEDLDLVVFHEDLPAIRKILENNGFPEISVFWTWQLQK